MHKVLKHILAASLAILALNASFAQAKLGLKLTSSIINQRISQSEDMVAVSRGANAFVPSFTIYTDMTIAKNYCFSTGLGYISKRINLNVQQSFDGMSQSQNYNIQYLQIPATLKLYTSEIALDKKLYFQLGPIFDIAIHSKENNNSLLIIDKFRPVDISLMFSAGLEIQVAPNTAIQLGINYSRGMVNVIADASVADLSIKNDLYGIDLAIKF